MMCQSQSGLIFLYAKIVPIQTKKNKFTKIIYNALWQLTNVES